nr:hypothetical protein [bacterium]
MQQTSSWRILGPGGGGAQYIPTISPFDDNTVYVACDMTGTYLTHDGGASWRQINFHSRVQAAAFDPHTPGVLWAGATGLYVSRDNGDSWQLVFPAPDRVTGETNTGDHAFHRYLSTDNWPGGSIEAICIDPADTQTMVIGVNTAFVDRPGEYHLRLLCTQDGGKSWAGPFDAEGTHFVKSFIPEKGKAYIFTDAGGFVYDAATHLQTALPMPQGVPQVEDVTMGVGTNGQPVFYMTTGYTPQDGTFHSGVFRSCDMGQSWRELTCGLDADCPKGLRRVFTRVAVSQSDASTVYVSLSEPMSDDTRAPDNAETFFGIFISRDGGEHFQWALRIGNRNPANRTLGWVETDFSTGWGGAPFNLGVSPNTTDICYASDWGTTYKTQDGGLTWQQVYANPHGDGTSTTRGLDVSLCYHLAFDPFDKNHIAMCCTDIGLLDTPNGGDSWNHRQDGVPHKWVNSCYSVAFDPDVPGRAWSTWTNCHDLPRPKMFRRGFDKRLGGVCRSEDGLKTWRVTSDGIDEHNAATCILLDPTSPVGQRTLYMAGMGSGVYKSTDDGYTWQNKSQGITGNLNVWKLYRQADGTLYAVVARGLENKVEIDGALYVSHDGAESWQNIALPDTFNAPNFLAWEEGQPNKLYLACWPRELNGQERWGGLIASDDGGKTWRQLYDECSHVYGVATDPDAPGTLYISTFENSVLRSDDDGATWRRLAGYDFKWAHQPVLDIHHKDMLFVCTFGSSLWYGPREGSRA